VQLIKMLLLPYPLLSFGVLSMMIFLSFRFPKILF
jgi:hypothetical protein